MRFRAPQTGQQLLVEGRQRLVRLLRHPAGEVDRCVRPASLELPIMKKPQAGEQERGHGGGAVDVRWEDGGGAGLVVILQKVQRSIAERRLRPEMLAHGARLPRAQPVVEPLVIGEVEPLFLQRPLEAPVNLGDEEELRGAAGGCARWPRARRGGRRVVCRRRGRPRSPQVRAMTSGSSNIAMSQRTPSARSAIRSSSPSIAWRRPPCR